MARNQHPAVGLSAAASEALQRSCKQFLENGIGINIAGTLAKQAANWGVLEAAGPRIIEAATLPMKEAATKFKIPAYAGPGTSSLGPDLVRPELAAVASNFIATSSAAEAMKQAVLNSTANLGEVFRLPQITIDPSKLGLLTGNEWALLRNPPSAAAVVDTAARNMLSSVDDEMIKLIEDHPELVAHASRLEDQMTEEGLIDLSTWDRATLGRRPLPTVVMFLALAAISCAAWGGTHLLPANIEEELKGLLAIAGTIFTVAGYLHSKPY